MTSRPLSSSFVALLFLSVPLASLGACTAGQNLGNGSDGGAEGGRRVVDITGNTPITTECSNAVVCCGTPASCEGRSEGDCATSGCSWAPQACSGVATACSQFDDLVCSLTPGCQPAPPGGNGPCTGTAVACIERTAGNCDDKSSPGASGCSMVGGCSGTPRACSAFGKNDCTTHEGCGLAH